VLSARALRARWTPRLRPRGCQVTGVRTRACPLRCSPTAHLGGAVATTSRRQARPADGPVVGKARPHDLRQLRRLLPQRLGRDRLPQQPPRRARPTRNKHQRGAKRRARQARHGKRERHELTTTTSSSAYPERKCANVLICRSFQWRDSESNRGHYDFQSYALPTELSRRWPIFDRLDPSASAAR
jgi:hypothetical protein